ncbi:MAG: inositol-3-phosphate synthase [Thermodesulfobacteriota bacterium]
MNKNKIGVWLIGALGSVSSAVILGALALRRGLIESTGMITTTEPFDKLGLVPVNALEFAGCDIRQGSLRDACRDMVEETAGIPTGILNELDDDLAEIEQNVSVGSAKNCGEAISRLASCSDGSCTSVRDEIAAVANQLEQFKTRNGLADVVVVNLASTEPPLELTECHNDLAAFEECLDCDSEDVVRASTIYAYASIQSGCAYVNFTPSNGALFPAMVQLAEQKGVPVMGNDGKTGETLVKSALAPMFLCRNLEVLSWEGYNILGNMDGRVLDHPQNKESKTKTKDVTLSRVLGYRPHSQVGINYVPSLGDQKVAWDFIHFRGFLGARMSLQFVWQGYDSLLAAPLVLDLVRLAEYAKRRGEAGLMPHLACYFKSPIGAKEHRLYEQFSMLMDYANQAKQAVGI